MTLGRGKFRVRGDTIEVHPSYEEHVLRIEMFGDTIDRITMIDPLTGENLRDMPRVQIFPATHYVAGDERMRKSRSSASRPSCRSGWRGSRPTASCSRRSGCGCARSTTWR